MTDFHMGYDAQWTLMKVDKNTWADVEPVGNVDSISVKRSCSDDVPLIEQGNATVTLPLGEEFETGWYRIIMHARQGSDRSRYAIATLLFEGYTDNTDYEVSTVSLDGYSVLKPVNDRKVTVGEYVAKNSDGAEWCAKKIRECLPRGVRVICEQSFSVDKYYVFSPNTTYLSAIWDLLDAAKWCIKIDGEGNIVLGPKPKTASLVLDKANASLLMPGIDRTLDVSDVPNRYYVISGNRVAVATNEDLDSRTSYVKRGWWKDEVETSPVLVNGESLQSCAERYLQAASTLVRTYSYTREYDAVTVPFDIVTGRLPNQIYADLRVVSQQLNCGGNGITVQEEAGEEVVEWKTSQ